MKIKFPWKEALATNKFAILFVIVAIVAFALAYVFVSDSYPVAMVNGSSLSKNKLQSNFAAASVYYDNILKTYRNVNNELKKPEDKELQADVLTKLIEAKLIEAGVRKEVGGDLEYLVSNKTEKFREDTELQGAAPVLYGMQFNEFWSEVLIPQAERDILAGRLFLRGEKIDDWLSSAKKDANIILLTDDFRWTGEKIEPTK